MKNIRVPGFIVVLILITIACKKETNQNPPTSSITVVNALENPLDVVVDLSDTLVPYYLNQAPISNASSAEFGIGFGNIPIIIVSSSDTSHPLFKGSLNLKPAAIYSFYLVGAEKAIDTFFMQDVIPVYSDSVSGIRFINLSPGVGSISINIQGNPSSQTEFSGLGYKQISAFKSYAASSSNSGSYIFEVRDQATGDSLTTVTWNCTLFKSNTAVIVDSQNSGGTNSIGGFIVRNF